MNLLKIFKKILRPVPAFLYYLSGFSKRDPQLWIFGAWEGFQYSDNTKYLFEYINSNHSEIKCIWFTKDKSIAKKIKSAGYKACASNSIKALYYALKASLVFETEGIQDIGFNYFFKGARTIQCWHGFPLKTGDNWKKVEPETLKPWQDNFDKMFWMSSSPKYSEVIQNWKLFGVKIPDNQFRVTGYARNDTFVTKPQNAFLSKFQKEHPDSKLICYMPTHRNFGNTNNTFLSEEELKKINVRLQSINVYMIFKPHFHELKKFIGKETQYDHIIFAYTEEFADVYSYIHGVDLLISDYSSIIIDYLCANKPIIIFDYDVEEYGKKEGLDPLFFEFDFGPRCKTWDEVLDNVENQLKNDSWKEKRISIMNLTNTYNDGQNCERIYKVAKEIALENQKVSHNA